MYRNLIRTICSTFSNGASEAPDLILLPASVEPDPQARPGQALFEVPEAMIPEGCETHHLTPNANFFDEAEQLLTRAVPGLVFAIPPWIREMDLPRDWRRNHPGIGLIEAFEKQAFHPP